MHSAFATDSVDFCLMHFNNTLLAGIHYTGQPGSGLLWQPGKYSSAVMSDNVGCIFPSEGIGRKIKKAEQSSNKEEVAY